MLPGDLMASGTDPGATYSVTGAVPGVYHEDRVIVTPVGMVSKTQMFRVAGATLTAGGVWNYAPGISKAYATVQNPDGSIHYLTYSGTDGWLTSAWEGSGNNAVYSALDFGMSTSDPTGGVANVTALQSAVEAAAAQGGTVVIPAGTYELSGSVNVTGVMGGLVIRGESAGTTLIQQGIPQEGTEVNLATDTFYCNGNEEASQSGIRFRDLTFQYAKGLNVPEPGVSAINCADSAFTTAEDCAFVNCPQAATLGEAQKSLLSGLVRCSIYQDGYNDWPQVVLGGAQCFMLYCHILQNNTGLGTGILVENGAYSSRIVGCHITDFFTGISVGGAGTQVDFTRITDCEINAAVALNIAPTDDTGTVYGVYASNCNFGMIMSYTPPTPTSGVFIDTAGGENSNVEGITLVDCIAYGYGHAGITINQGQSIAIIGGKYSSNGTNPGSSASGIAITGPCADVRIVGADCSGVFDFLGSIQPYGISVLSSVTGVIVSGCNLTGNATSPLYVPTNGTDLRVIDCAGYNDQGTVVKSTAPAPSAPFNGGTFGYYGSVTFYASNSSEATISEIAIQSNNTNLLSGTFTLAAGVLPVASIDWNGTGSPNFLMIGQ